SIIRGFKIATIKKIKDLILKENLNPNPNKNNSNNPGEINSNNPGEINFRSTGELQFAPTPFAPTPFALTTKKIKSLDFKIWQRNYYEHIIRTEIAYQRISNYIINNPKNWKKDKFK